MGFVKSSKGQRAMEMWRKCLLLKHFIGILLRYVELLFYRVWVISDYCHKTAVWFQQIVSLHCIWVVWILSHAVQNTLVCVPSHFCGGFCSAFFGEVMTFTSIRSPCTRAVGYLCFSQGPVFSQAHYMTDGTNLKLLYVTFLSRSPVWFALML